MILQAYSTPVTRSVASLTTEKPVFAGGNAGNVLLRTDGSYVVVATCDAYLQFQAFSPACRRPVASRPSSASTCMCMREL